MPAGLNTVGLSDLPDSEYFEQNPKAKYRVRRPMDDDSFLAADPERGVLVARCGKKNCSVIKHLLDDDAEAFSEATDDDLVALAYDTPFALNRDEGRFLSLEDVRRELEQEMEAFANRGKGAFGTYSGEPQEV